MGEQRGTSWRIPYWVAIGLAILCLLIGYGLGKAARVPAQAKMETPKQANILFWTCAMHPQIHSAEPGNCPICGMKLIPVYEEDQENAAGPRQVALSPQAAKLAEVETAPVERKFVDMRVRLAGRIMYDETRLAYITAWVPGRLEKLFVDYTGIVVRKGDKMVEIFSPDLINAQQELILAARSAADTEKASLISTRSYSTGATDIFRQKLRLWGLTEKQVAEIEKQNKPSDRLGIYAPISGTVIAKNALEGMYVDTGTQIYTIADLSRVWATLQAYESDLSWLRYWQDVEFTAEALPGETFTGHIWFIGPVVDEKTRTVSIQVDIPNLGGKLKPDTLVSGIVHSRIDAEGKVMGVDLTGKYVCPMHPAMMKDGPGTCEIYGTPLVPAQDLGYGAPVAQPVPPLVVPASAPLVTGARAVVYVAVADKPGVYEGREVVLGPRAGDYYVVKQGLAEGERVVVKGNFLIDSSLQIQAKPSMMSPEGGVTPAMPGMPGMPAMPGTPAMPSAPTPPMPGMEMPMPETVPGKKP